MGRDVRCSPDEDGIGSIPSVGSVGWVIEETSATEVAMREASQARLTSLRMVEVALAK
jgi:hypothetical protein